MIKWANTGEALPPSLKGLISGLVVLVDSMDAGLSLFAFGFGSLFLDRDEESIPSLQAQTFEVGPRNDYPQVVALVDHFDL
jgi:hypothetical protein